MEYKVEFQETFFQKLIMNGKCNKSLIKYFQREGYRFTEDEPPRSKALPKDPNVVSSRQEEDDIAKVEKKKLNFIEQIYA